MDEQKVSSCSFSLFQALAELADDIAPAPIEMAGEIEAIEEKDKDSKDENVRLAMADEVHVLTEGLDPKLTYRKAREVMTRSVAMGLGGVRSEWLDADEYVTTAGLTTSSTSTTKTSFTLTCIMPFDRTRA